MSKAEEWGLKAMDSDGDSEQPIVAFLGIFEDLEGDEANEFRKVID